MMTVTWGGNSGPLVKFGLEMSKLEYGKGKELKLKDESRGLRLFDEEDRGRAPRECCKPPSYVPYKGTYVPYDGTVGAPDQGQMLDM